MMISNTYKLNTGMRCVKYMLLVINFMFMLTAILLILVGTTIQTIFGDFKQFIDNYFLSPPTLLVTVGCIMFIVSIFGCFGAIKESTMLTNIYGVLLLIIFILEISASITSFLLQGQVRTMLSKTMNYTFSEYEQNIYTKESIDFLQTNLQCCGVHGRAEWDNKEPDSCCGRFAIDETGERVCVDYNEIGCFYQLTGLLTSSAMLIATGAITVAFVQLLGVFCAFMLAKTIRRNKSIRAARIWQLQQNLGILANGGKNSFDNGYTQLSKSNIEKCTEPVTYTATSPSVN